jgi:hypothetical protein
MIKKIILIFAAATALSACTLPFIGKRQAALQVTSSPAATLFLNGNHLGSTPYFDDNLKPGNYTLKLTLESGSSDWETKITLSPKLLTVVNRQFASSDDESSYYILQLEPLANKNSTELAVVASPDSAIVKLDNQPKGFAPLNLNNITSGDHTITLAAPGFHEITIKPKTPAGHKLTIIAQLARDKGLPESEPQVEATPSGEVAGDTTASPSPSPNSKTATSSGIIAGAASAGNLDRPYVKITDTGTGWLRVHSDAVPGGNNEIARVKVNTYFTVIKIQGGWYQIEYQTGKTGWITSRYADLTQ